MLLVLLGKVLMLRTFKELQFAPPDVFFFFPVNEIRLHDTCELLTLYKKEGFLVSLMLLQIILPLFFSLKYVKKFFFNFFPCIFKVKLSSLNLDDHAKKKLIKLVGDRYCKSTDVLTIKTDR